MTRASEIVAAYERIERERGGYTAVIPDEIAEAVAAEMEIPTSVILDVMLDHWTMQGAG